MDDQQWEFDEIYSAPENYKEVEVTLFEIEKAVYSLKWYGGVGPLSKCVLIQWFGHCGGYFKIHLIRR